MRILETKQTYCVDTEVEAKDLIEEFRASAQTKGYTIKKSGYEYKKKTSKGDIIGEKWVVTVVMTHGTLWEEL